MNNGFSEKEMDLLNNVSRQTAQKLSKVISAFLGKTALMSFNRAALVSAEDLAAKISQAQFCLPYSAGNEEKAMLMVAPRLGILIGELLLGNDGQNQGPEFNEQNKEAATQTFQKLIEAQASALFQVSGAKYEFKGENSEVCLPQEAASRLGGSGQWLLIEYKLGIQGFFEETVYDLLPLSLARRIAASASEKMAESGSQVNAWNLDQFSGAKKAGTSADLSLLLDTPLRLTVELGKTKMSLKNVLDLGIGSIVELDKLAGEPVDIKINNKMLAKGEVVVIDDNFGVRIVNIAKPDERV